jgi:type IV pilus biogenesis protein CpaD/CtpE
MSLRLCTWLIVASTAAALLAGCGSSGSTTSSQTTASQTQSKATSPLPPAAAQQAATSCKHAIQTETRLTASEKTKLEAVCQRAASGNGSNLQQVAHEVCVELIAASHVPAGADRERALALCKLK